MKQLILLSTFLCLSLIGFSQEGTKSTVITPNSNQQEFNSGRTNREKEGGEQRKKSSPPPSRSASPGSPAPAPAPVSPPDTIVVPSVPPIAPAKPDHFVF